MFWGMVLSCEIMLLFYKAGGRHQERLGAMSTWACVQSHVCGVDSLTTVAEVPVLMVALSYPLA